MAPSSQPLQTLQTKYRHVVLAATVVFLIISIHLDLIYGEILMQKSIEWSIYLQQFKKLDFAMFVLSYPIFFCFFFCQSFRPYFDSHAYAFKPSSQPFCRI